MRTTLYAKLAAVLLGLLCLIGGLIMVTAIYAWAFEPAG